VALSSLLILIHNADSRVYQLCIVITRFGAQYNCSPNLSKVYGFPESQLAPIVLPMQRPAPECLPIHNAGGMAMRK
jgi:hypothetical protein